MVYVKKMFMQKSLLLVLILFLINKETRADCNPAFTATVQQATVHVQAVNTAPHLLHRWNFNGALIYGSSASFTYSAPGTYSIVHRVMDSLGSCEDSVVQTVTINFQNTCAASFTATRDSSQPNRYYFSSTSVATGTSISSYYWVLNGSTPMSYSQSFSYTLPAGLNTICLYIGTTGGCTSSSCDSIMVTAADTCNLMASFTATASSSNPRQISFMANPSSNTSLYNWSFGDGYSSLQQNPIHTYAQAGAYGVRLRIYDPVHGCFDTIIQNMVVYGLPSDSCTASFTYTADSSHPNQVHFTAASNQTITSQLWQIDHWTDPNDSIFMTTNNPTYTFTDTGYYQICLYITTNTGCTKLYCNGIYINNVGARIANTIPSFPNPATSSISLRVKLTEANSIGITVYNLSGYAVYKMQKHGVAGTNELTIPVQQLKSGQYFIDIKYGDQQKRSIFQKL